jgi:hypothetical protein
MNPQLHGVAPLFVLWDSPLILIPAALTLYCGWALNVRNFQFMLRVCAPPDIYRRRTQRLGEYFAAIPLWATLVLGVMVILGVIVLEHSELAGGIVPAQWFLLALLVTILLAPAISFALRAARTGQAWLRWYLPLLIWIVLVFGLSVAEEELTRQPHLDKSLLSVCVEGLLSYTVLASFVVLVLSPVFWKLRWQVLRVGYVVAVYPLVMVITFCIAAAAIFWGCGFVAICVGSMLR